MWRELLLLYQGRISSCFNYQRFCAWVFILTSLEISLSISTYVHLLLCVCVLLLPAYPSWCSLCPGKRTKQSEISFDLLNLYSQQFPIHFVDYAFGQFHDWEEVSRELKYFRMLQFIYHGSYLQHISNAHL